MFGHRVGAAVAAVAVLVAACGDDGPDAAGVGVAAQAGTAESPRTIEIAMVDIGYAPAAVSVQAGETVRFRFTNDGAVRHEATFGDEAEQEEHGALMRESEDMGGMDMGGADMDGAEADDMVESGEGHDEPPPLVLEPGESGEVIVTFDDPDTSSTIIGCHEPGHWEAGMREDVTVVTA